jgi:hypothetical protein
MRAGWDYCGVTLTTPSRGRAVHRSISLRGRATELCIYAVIAVGLSLWSAQVHTSRANPKGRYTRRSHLLPLLPIAAAALALTARGARRYWPAIGVIIVLISLTHDIFSQLQGIARFYG